MLSAAKSGWAAGLLWGMLVSAKSAFELREPEVGGGVFRVVKRGARVSGELTISSGVVGTEMGWVLSVPQGLGEAHQALTKR